MDIGVLNHDVKLTKDQMEGPPDKLAETCIGFFDYRLEAVGEGGSIEPVDEVDEVDEVESTPNTPSAPSATSNTEPIRLETLEEQP
jgi:hypothetical protein